MEEQKQEKSELINTEGGAYVEGDVDTQGGDFIGRDQIIHGDNVSGDKVSIGKLIFNVAQANLKPLFLISSLGLLGIVGILAVLLWPETTGSLRMQGTFNIAVAAFDKIENKSIHPSQDGEKIANWLTNQLKSEESSYPLGTQIEIWGPERTGRISGLNAGERAEAARVLADKIGANIIVYGALEVTDGSAKISPEFYVSLDEDTDLQEITGPHRLGSPIPISDDIFQNPVTNARLNSELFGRSLALSHFTIGLIYFSLDDFNEAKNMFTAALQTEGWEDDQGKEVIYLFLGNSSLNLKDYPSANDSFNRALVINNGYARAFIGQGLTYFQEAVKPLDDSSNPHVNVNLLDQAIDSFQLGLEAPDQPAGADVEWKAHFGLGRSFLVKSIQGEADLWAEAETELKLVTDAYEEGNVRLQELAAQSFGQLGLMNYILGNDEEAIIVLEKALSLGQIDKYKSEWAKLLSEIYNGHENLEAAARYTEMAEELTK